MTKNIIQKLIENNELPILFVGSGMSLRFLEGYPNWIGLLMMIWKEVYKNDQEEDFFRYANKIKKDLDLEENPDANYFIMPKIAEYLDKVVEEKFIKGELDILGLTQEQVFKYNIKPIKKMIANIFSTYKVKENMRDELEAYANLLFKSQIIFTTNYDSLIEDKIIEQGANPNVYIGQSGFFEDTLDYSEVYKVHGSFNNPNSIIISVEDYNEFASNSILITSKLISKLLYNPIIFLGYSVSDPNIRNIIHQFAKSLSEEELNRFSERFIVVSRKENEMELLEKNHYDRDLNFTYTLIETDNYKTLFDELTKINQGLPPSEIKKYYKLIKELILTRSKAGQVDKLLLSYKNIDNYEEFTNNKNTVIAFGDERFVYTVPTLSVYIRSYLGMEEEMSPEIALTFIAKDSTSGRLPLRKYYTDEIVRNLRISEQEKARIRNKYNKDKDINKLINSVNCRSEYSDINDIRSLKTSINQEYGIVLSNIKRLYLDDVLLYIKEKVEEEFKSNSSMNSTFRKLLVAYDILRYGRK